MGGNLLRSQRKIRYEALLCQTCMLLHTNFTYLLNVGLVEHNRTAAARGRRSSKRLDVRFLVIGSAKLMPPVHWAATTLRNDRKASKKLNKSCFPCIFGCKYVSCEKSGKESRYRVRKARKWIKEQTSWENAQVIAFYSTFLLPTKRIENVVVLPLAPDPFGTLSLESLRGLKRARGEYGARRESENWGDQE